MDEELAAVMDAALTERLERLSPAKRALFEQLRQREQTSRQFPPLSPGGRGLGSEGENSAIRHRRQPTSAPLALAQERLWYLDQLEPGNPFYNVATAVRIRGPLDASMLEAALQAVVARHDALRTTFPTLEGEPRQVVSRESLFRLWHSDLSHLDPHERDLRLQELAAAESLRSFDLASGPLIRATLVRVAADDHVLLLTLHHIVCDGWSMAVLRREVGEHYAALVAGRPPNVEPLPLQYADFACWQRDELHGAKVERLLNFWSRELAHLPAALPLPLDRPRPAVQTYRGDVARRRLDRKLVQRLNALAAAEHATPYMLLLSAWQVLLGRFARRRDVAVATPVAQRQRRELEPLIGFFVNTLVLRGRFEDDPTFREFLARVRGATLAAFEHEELPFARLVEHLLPPRDPSRPPLAQVMFVMQNIPIRAQEVAGLRIEETSYDHAPVSHYDLTLNVDASRPELDLSLVFNPDLFERDTAERLLAAYETLLRAIVADADRRVSELEIVPACDREQLTAWNETAVEFPHEQTIHELFVAQARRSPDAVALEFEDERLTYAQLDRRSNRLARVLVERGVSADMPVGLALDRSFELIVGMLAVLKAGGCYVPLDPAYPAARRAYMIADSGVSLVLTTSRLARNVSPGAVELLLVDDEQLGAESASEEPIAARSASSDLAYILYTSGSTGEPKGVEVEHRGLVNHALAFAAQCGLAPGDRMLQFLSPSFDAAAEEIFPTLTSGATLRLHPAPAELAGASLLDWSREHGVNVLHLPIAVWRSLLTAIEMDGAESASHLRLVIAGGDNLPRDMLARWRELTGDRIRFLFAYGLTEATITSTLFNGAEPAVSSGADRVPIGRPIANHRVYVLDERGHLAPIGVAGELVIGGVGVARGYHGRSELTAQRFVVDPWSQQAGARMYRTGDLGRYLSDGKLEFLGRVDAQLKIRGHRVEPAEIEAALLEHPAVREAIVLPHGEGELRRLAAYVACPDESGAAEPEIIDYLRTRLPAHLLPAAVAVLPELPHLPGAKVDVASLPAPVWQRADQDRAFVEPQEDVERRLAAIWSEVLGVERIGRHDNFFELGGDSIRSIQVVARAAAAGLRITPKQFLERQTLAELAAVAGTAPEISAEQGPVTGPTPLLPIQRQFFAWDLAEAHHFNQSVLLEIDPRVTSTALSSAVREILAHHDALRMRYERAGDEWRQTGTPVEEGPVLARIDVSDLSDEEFVMSVERHAAEAQAGLNLQVGPIARFVHFDRGREQTGRLLIAIHHLAVDAVSWRILLEDLNVLVAQLLLEQSPVLPPKTTSYRAWAERLVSLADSETVGAEMEYWLVASDSDAGPLPCELSAGSNEDVNTQAQSDTIRAALDEETTRALLGDAQQAYRTRPQELLAAALTDVLTDFTGRERVTVDFEGHGREALADDVDLSRTVGWFTSLYPVNLRRPPSAGPRDLICGVKEQLRQVRHGGLSFGLLRWMASDPEVRDRLAALPRAEVSFNYLGQFDHLLPDEALLRPIDGPHGSDRSPSGTRPHVWEIIAYVRHGQLHVEWSYSQALHARETVERLAEHYANSLTELVEHCLDPNSGCATPADFSLAGVDQDDLDQLAALLERDPD